MQKAQRDALSQTRNLEVREVKTRQKFVENFVREIYFRDWSIFFFNLEIKWWIKWKSVKIMDSTNFYLDLTYNGT